MRAIHAVLIVLVLALLAGGLWLALHGADGSGRDREGLTRDQGGEVGAADPSRPLELGGGAGRDETGDPGRRAALVGEAGEGVGNRAARGPTRIVRGRVVDELAGPIARATVYYASARASGGMRIDRVASLPGWVEVKSVETDTAGEFELPVRFRDDLSLAVRAPGFAPLRTERALSATGETRLEDLVMLGSVILGGHVVDRAGIGVEGAELHELGLAEGGLRIGFLDVGGEPLCRTDASGTFEIDELPAGPYRLRIHHPDHPDLFTEGVSGPPGQVVRDLRFVLEDGLPISGLVLGLEQGEHTAFEVRATPTLDEFVDPLDSFTAHRTAGIEANGTFQVLGLRSDSSHRLTVIDAGSPVAFLADSRSSVIHARAGETGVALELREPFALTFAVVDDSDGTPITSFEVEAGQPWLETLRDAQGNVLREHPEGRVRHPDVPAPAGQTRTDLRIRASGYETVLLEDVPLAAGVERDLGIVRLHPVPRLLVRVLDAATGEPIEGARVTVAKAVTRGGGRSAFAFRTGGDSGLEELDLPGGREVNRGVTDGSGWATLASLPGERCEVSVRHRAYADHVSDPVALPPGVDFSLELELLRGGTVIVTVIDSKGEAVPKARVAHRKPRENPNLVVLGGPPARRTRSDGTATFRRLGAGTHHFSLADEEADSLFRGSRVVLAGAGARGGENDGQDVNVGEGTTHEITLREKPRGTLRGVVTESGKPLAGASLSFRPEREKPAEDSILIPGLGRDQTVRSDSRGRYEIEGLKVGDYVVAIGHPSRAMDAELDLEVREGEQERDFALVVTILEGRVTDSSGQPVEGIEVLPRRSTPTAASRSMVMITRMSTEGGGGALNLSAGTSPATSAFTDRDGRYSIRGVDADVEIYAETLSNDYQPGRSEPVVVGRGETRRGADIEVYAAGSISLAVVNADGTPAAYCMARFTYQDDEAGKGAEPRDEFVGESGRLEITSLRPGRWAITVTSVPLGGEGAEVEAPPVEVLVVPGETVEAVSELP